MLPSEPDVSGVPQNRLKRYKLMQQQIQLFWKRWLSEYLPQLQRRGKWTKPTRNFSIGDLAILRDDNMTQMAFGSSYCNTSWWRWCGESGDGVQCVWFYVSASSYQASITTHRRRGRHRRQHIN